MAPAPASPLVHPADRGELRLQGSRIALLAFGSTVAAAEQVGRELGLSVVNMRFIKPLDRELVLSIAAQHEGLVTIEDNVVAGGAGSGVGELLNAEARAARQLAVARRRSARQAEADQEPTHEGEGAAEGLHRLRWKQVVPRHAWKAAPQACLGRHRTLSRS